MANSDLSEEQMRRALGLAEAPATKTRKKGQPAQRLATQVVLSVRKDDGVPVRFVHRSSSVSSLVARMEAEEAAKKQGYKVWALLDIQQVSD